MSALKEESQFIEILLQTYFFYKTFIEDLLGAYSGVISVFSRIGHVLINLTTQVLILLKYR
jgi:hypothetical protein